MDIYINIQVIYYIFTKEKKNVRNVLLHSEEHVQSAVVQPIGCRWKDVRWWHSLRWGAVVCN